MSEGEPGFFAGTVANIFLLLLGNKSFGFPKAKANKNSIEPCQVKRLEMEASPLKVTAAMKIITTRQLSLRMLIDIIRQPQSDALLSEVSTDDKFWIAVAKNYCDQDWIIRRMDLSDEDWRKFVMDYYLDYGSLYTIIVEGEHAFRVLEGPMLIRRGDKDNAYRTIRDRMLVLANEPAHRYELIFELEGTEPLKGCLGYTARFQFGHPVHTSMSRCHTFVCRDEASQIPVLFDRLVEFLAKEFLDMVLHHLGHYFHGGSVWILGTEFKQIPALKEIKEIVRTMVWQDGKFIDFNDEGYLGFNDFIIHVRTERGQESRLTMFIDLSQLRF